MLNSLLFAVRSVAGTTGLEPATSAVTVNWKRVTYRNQEARMARFGSLRHPWQHLMYPYRTYDLCPVDLCPNPFSPYCQQKSWVPNGFHQPSGFAKVPLRSVRVFGN